MSIKLSDYVNAFSKYYFNKFRPVFAFAWTIAFGILLGFLLQNTRLTWNDKKLEIIAILVFALIPWIPLVLEMFVDRLSKEIFLSRASFQRDFHTANKLLAQRRRWEAVEEFKNLLKESPDDPELLYRLAEVTWLELGNAPDALARFLALWKRIQAPDKNIIWDHSLSAERAVTIAIHISDIHYLSRNFQSARRILEELLSIRGRDLREKKDAVEENIENLKRLKDTRPSTLVLFDIDGTLSDSGGAGGKAVATAFEEIYGKAVDLKSIDFRGRTDISLWREMLASHGLSYSPDDPYLVAFKEKYIELLRKLILKSNPKSTPGARPLLERLERAPTVALGLLTGNIETGGRTKLQAIDLNRFFPVGAFGEDGEDRSDIAHTAVRRAREFYGADFAPDRIYIVGDAEADIRAARSVKAKCIAVGTGWTSREDLIQQSPDFFLEDFRHLTTFLDHIGIQDPSGHRLSAG